MNQIYLDTNIYIYLSQSDSSFNNASALLVKKCKKKGVSLVTSVETIEEIIHYSKRYSQLSAGLEIAKSALEISDHFLNIERQTIEKYLFFVQKYRQYKKIDSRDFIHLATCYQYQLETIITYDKDFKKFKEISSLTPEEFLKK